jgi:cell filamentation protein
MSNEYKYVDGQFIYIDPKTGLLRNILGIEDEETLLFVESGAVTKRLQELYEQPIRIRGVVDLFSIHQHLFQDVYEWAGKKRVVEMSKDGKQFFPIENFDTALVYIDSLIDSHRVLSTNKIEDLAILLADILDNVNYLHPFREGNGRVQREFLRLLALEKDLVLNLNPINDSTVYDRYMTGTVNSDLNELKDLIFELISNEKE